MNLKRRDLLISFVLIVLFIIMGLSVNVFASTNFNDFVNAMNNNTNNNNNINNNINQISTITGSDNSINNTTKINNTNNTNNTPEQLADTGLEVAPWLIIGVCVVSAVFAYNKVREYNIK